jgi:hypothetical protein
LIKVAALALAGVASLGALGCGSQAGDDTRSEPPRRTYPVEASTTVETVPDLDKEEFLVRANEICRTDQIALQEDFADYLAEQKPGKDQKDVFAYAAYSFLLPRIQYQFDFILQVGGPSGEEADVEEVLGAMQYAIETLEKERVPTPAKLSMGFTDFNQLAYEYGMDDCPVDRERYPWMWEKDPVSVRWHA